MFNLKGNICILGDSIVYGAWDEEKHGYVNRLREDLKENNQVENIYGLGIPGETTAGLLKRIDTELKIRRVKNKKVEMLGEETRLCVEEILDLLF